MRRADGVGVESDRFMSSGSTLKPKQKEAVVSLLFYAVRPIRSKRTYLQYPISLQREMRAAVEDTTVRARGFLLAKVNSWRRALL